MIEKKLVLDAVVKLMLYYTGPEHTDGYWALHKIYDNIKKLPEERSRTCDFYVKDKTSGQVHRVGSNVHDGIWVDGMGMLHYQNMQNGDGCSGYSALNDECGYEFVSSDFGEIDDATEIWKQEDRDR